MFPRRILALLLAVLLFGFCQPAHGVPTQPTPDSNAQQPGTSNPAQGKAEVDPLKDIVIYPRPEDFPSAQHLALQNREERLALVQKAIECIEHSKNINDIYACQMEERKALDRIWLSYCNTTLSFLSGVRAMPKPGQDPNSIPRTADCDKALSAVTGKPLPSSGNGNNGGNGNGNGSDANSQPQQPDNTQ